MSNPTDYSVQGHLTISFPMKSAADCAAARDKIPTLVPDLYRAADAMGTLHYCRFIELNDTIYLLADFDGDVETILEGLAKHLGPVLNPVFGHVSDAPPTPVANNTQAFVKWAKDHYIEPFATYCAYPGATVQKIKSLASAAGIALNMAGVEQHPLLVIMPMRSRLSVVALQATFMVLGSHINKGGDAVGTVHFIHVARLTVDQVGFFTIYDGTFDNYIQDFADQLGPAFDLMFKLVVDPIPTPTSKNVGPFTKWTREHDLAPLAFYSAYPGLQVQDIKALLADAS